MWRHIGPTSTWSVTYGAGVLVFCVVSYLVSRRLQLRRRVWVAVSVSYIVGMTTGAKLLFDLQHGQANLPALLNMEHYLSGGLWGGPLAYLILAVPSVLILARSKCDALDLVALSLPLPMILAKLGCIFNGCCYGRACAMPWAITFPPGAYSAPVGVPIHPTQTYEIVALVCILVTFNLLKHERWRGTMLLWFLIIYGFGRAGGEVFRADLQERGYMIGSVSLSQLACAAAACLSIAVLCLRRGPDGGTPGSNSLA